jgi:predicted membrane metal-binding protein
MQLIINKIVDVITTGTRPFRILFFGGVFLALIIMNVLAKVFNVNTKLGGDINFANVILIIVSMLAGFGISYSIVHFADASKRKRMGK